MVVYLAAPLFTQVERRWNRELARLLEERIDGLKVVLPQDCRVDGRYNDRRRLEELFTRCIEGVRAADVVVAILDGPDADSGVAFEMGYAHASGKPIVGVRTDFRQSQERGVNLMVSRPCAEFVCRMSFNESVEALADDVAKKIGAVAGEARRGDGTPSSRDKPRDKPRGES
jgi:nucleoside 2-deoxyribosyltransferase